MASNNISSGNDLKSTIRIDGIDYNVHAVTAQTAEDAKKLDGVPANEYAKKIDIPEGQDLSAYAKKSDLFSKNYNDLTNKPTIPTNTNQTVKADGKTFGANDVVEFVAGTNVTIIGNNTDTAKTITISATGGGGGGDGDGDMLKSVYVTGQANNTNKVDKAINAEQLGGVAASNYAKKSDIPNITVSREDPTDGATGDIWFKY